MFEFDRVTKRYPDALAADQVSLVIAAGNTTALIGPSGSGKSTLLRMMVGLVWPDQGLVSFDGKPLHRATVERVRQRIGYMIQDGGLFPHLNGERNVSIMARYLGWSADRIDARLSELAALTHLPHALLQRLPHEMSGGQRQRVSLIRALFLGPEVLLLDEPLGKLDPMVRFELQQELKEIFAGLNTTVVLVTHDLAEAHHFSESLVLMRHGAVVQRGSLNTFREDPHSEFVSRFVEAQRGLSA